MECILSERKFSNVQIILLKTQLGLVTKKCSSWATDWELNTRPCESCVIPAGGQMGCIFSNLLWLSAKVDNSDTINFTSIS